MKSAFVIAGSQSGAGKTTATLTLLAAFHDKAMIVQPFKIGPDYLDPGYHNLFSGGRKSRNLDSFLLTEEFLKSTFRRNTQRTDVALVEGVMGLFDGKSGSNETGSTAQVAKMLGLPVVLVIDAWGMGRSAAAVILGFKEFDPALNLCGVIFNRVSGEEHYKHLKDSVKPEWDIEVLGYIQYDPEIIIPERHLGLTSALENPLEMSFFDRLKKASQFVKTDRLFELTRVRAESSRPEPLEEKPKKVRVGIAFDEAFSFYYEDNFDLLKDAGAELVFFSPLYGNALPPDLDALYIGGGFPEMFAPKLSRNLSMMESIHKFADSGHLIYAECGGLIYLAEKFRDRDGQQYNLLGLVPGVVEMTDRLQSFGYKEIVAESNTFLFRKGEKLRSHEFHYSRWINGSGDYEKPYRVGQRDEGYYHGSVLASYQHLHFGSQPSLASNFVDAILENKVGAKTP